jgi:hypothetical protein
VRRQSRCGLSVAYLACVAAFALFCACGRAAKMGEWDDGGGTKITWSPARPEIGDLVSLTLVTETQDKLSADSGAVIQAPDGRELEPQRLRYMSRNVMAVWSFRIEAPGEYRWKGRALWTTESAAGNETELRTVEPQALWDGRAKGAESTATASAAPKNGQAAPAQPAPAQGGPAPQAIMPQSTPGGSI